MAMKKERVQAYVELRSEDAEANSVLAVARDRLEAGRALEGLSRYRLIEIVGSKLEPREVGERLHGSTQFYNPVKERCTVRVDAKMPAPVAPGDVLVLVYERGGERRESAERWWRREAGQRIEVKEGTVWALRFAPGADGASAARELSVTKDRAHGLFANAHFQECRVRADGAPPLDWMTPKAARSTRGPRGRA
jgi:hypothetical protein